MESEINKINSYFLGGDIGNAINDSIPAELRYDNTIKLLSRALAKMDRSNDKNILTLHKLLRHDIGWDPSPNYWPNAMVQDAIVQSKLKIEKVNILINIEDPDIALTYYRLSEKWRVYSIASLTLEICRDMQAIFKMGDVTQKLYVFILECSAKNNIYHSAHSFIIKNLSNIFYSPKLIELVSYFMNNKTPQTEISKLLSTRYINDLTVILPDNNFQIFLATLIINYMQFHFTPKSIIKRLNDVSASCSPHITCHSALTHTLLHIMTMEFGIHRANLMLFMKQINVIICTNLVFNLNPIFSISSIKSYCQAMKVFGYFGQITDEIIDGFFS